MKYAAILLSQLLRLEPWTLGSLPWQWCFSSQSFGGALMTVGLGFPHKASSLLWSLSVHWENTNLKRIIMVCVNKTFRWQFGNAENAAVYWRYCSQFKVKKILSHHRFYCFIITWNVFALQLALISEVLLEKSHQHLNQNENWVFLVWRK